MALSNVTLNSNLLLVTLQDSSRGFISYNGSSIRNAVIQNLASGITIYNVGDNVMVDIRHDTPAFVEISGVQYYIISLDQIYLREDVMP